MSDPANATPTLISMRPVDGHAALRRAAARHGLRLLAVSPWRLQPNDDEASGQALARALAAPVVVFTSPAAARAAASLMPLRPPAQGRWLAVGEGTARALRAAGVPGVAWPPRMDSEGLLAMPALSGDGPIGLVTAPGGRGLLAAELERGGRQVIRANVYSRVPITLAQALLQRLQALASPTVLLLSSAEALQRVMPQLPPGVAARWRAQPVVAASQRLAELAREAGFAQVRCAQGPLPAQLVAAAITSSPLD
ncbi:MAG TPA: uroporphyrinogen-III synthase [Stenotrophomonas sp.]|jgi:uroporphyrinogen-III synthase